MKDNKTPTHQQKRTLTLPFYSTFLLNKNLNPKFCLETSTKPVRLSGRFNSAPIRLAPLRFEDGSSSRTSLASSRQSLTSYASPTTERAVSPEQGKRAAFVEVGRLLNGAYVSRRRCVDVA